MAFLKSVALATLALAGGVVSRRSTSRSDPIEPCGRIAQQINGLSSKVPAAITVNADTALACMKSVPFNQTAAGEFIEWFKFYVLDFQSTTAYLKNPPSSYQQPAADLVGDLQKIADNVKRGKYQNYYDFECDVYQSVQSAHEGHFSVRFAASAFLWRIPYALTSLSRDGKELPKIYLFEEVNTTHFNPDNAFIPSAIKTINNQDAVTYLQEWARGHISGYVEPHADWNAIFPSAADPLRFESTTLNSRRYVDSWFNVTFDNGTRFETPFVAELGSSYNRQFAEITDGQSFYEQFVQPLSKGIPSAPLTVSEGNNKQVPSGLQKWPLAAYPHPFIRQYGLGEAHDEVDGNAWVTGYMIDNQSLAVLSIPSFETVHELASNFSDTVGSFISQAKSAGVKKVLIDVRQNGGGTGAASLDIFKHFFPDLEDSEGYRMRSFKTYDAIASSFSKLYEEVIASGNKTAYGELLDSGTTWISQLYLDMATGKNFSSWQEVQQQIYKDNGDSYTPAVMYDFNNTEFGMRMASYSIQGYANRTNSSAKRPFAVEDVAILTDGLCSSTCASFVELFAHNAGVKTIVVGGQPKTGPMQAASGTRGGQAYTANQVQKMISILTEEYGVALNVSEPPPGFNVTSTNINLRDVVRHGETFPLQFEYAPASCRIFYTPKTFNDFTNLWIHAALAVFSDGSLCVEGSTGLRQTATNKVGPNAGGHDDSGSDSGTDSALAAVLKILHSIVGRS